MDDSSLEEDHCDLPFDADWRLNPQDGQIYTLPLLCAQYAEAFGQEETEVFWGEQCTGARRIFILRHGDRLCEGHDPPLTERGEQQAQQAAEYLAGILKDTQECPSEVVAIFCSPFLRALQTAAPVARALGLPVFVEWGFCELLGHGWLQAEDPLPFLHSRGFAELPMKDVIDLSYETAVIPQYPDVTGRLNQGETKRRERPLRRHGRAVHSALRTTQGKSFIIVAHASTHDFVAGAMCPDEHPNELHTPSCVAHCGITQLVRKGVPATRRVDKSWVMTAFGATPWVPCGDYPDGMRDVAAENAGVEQRETTLLETVKRFAEANRGQGSAAGKDRKGPEAELDDLD